MQDKFGTLANTKTDLSTEVLAAEEEKLKVQNNGDSVNILKICTVKS